MKLYIPLKPAVFIQGYGLANTSPEMVVKYNQLGIKGHNGIDYRIYRASPPNNGHPA